MTRAVTKAVSLANSPISDDALMARITNDDRHAFGAFYIRYEERAWTVASLLCQDQVAAEAAVTGTFRTLWRGRAVYHLAGDSAYQRMVRLLYRQSVVQRRSAPEVVGAATAIAPDPTGTPDDAGVVVLLGRLPDRQRDVIVLALYGELSHAQIADLLDIAPGDIKGRMRLGLDELRTPKSFGEN